MQARCFNVGSRRRAGTCILAFLKSGPILSYSCAYLVTSGGSTSLPARGIPLDQTADPAIIRPVQLLDAGSCSSTHADDSSEIDFYPAASACAHIRRCTSEATGQVVAQLSDYRIIQGLAASVRLDMLGQTGKLWQNCVAGWTFVRPGVLSQFFSTMHFVAVLLVDEVAPLAAVRRKLIERDY
jgi:hypothetical protein